ncbi:MAG TPA: hypothetical protein VNN80_05345, partial [Polyangiaceae bacterium]|nr:hypothetical protein [Polyangiaceae bacterium]
MALLAAHAEAQPDSGATTTAPPAPLSVWYRSSEGCPEGSVFVARLAELGRPATLARVGDRVDFVVTVARTPDASSGRLERQTARGTVAIRELDAARCDEVTEALALSLEIALDPANEAPSTGADPSSIGGASNDAGEAPALLPTPVRPLAADRTPDTPAREDARRGALTIGAQGS